MSGSIAAARRLIVAAGLALAGCTGPLGGGSGPSLHSALGDADVVLAVAALQDGLETRHNGEAARWRNPASGHGGAIVPRVTLVSDTGSFCRRYDERLELADGRTATSHGTACRDAAGRWVWLAD